MKKLCNSVNLLLKMQRVSSLMHSYGNKIKVLRENMFGLSRAMALPIPKP